MSLPDTIFIFVLALIIFGPKKLPEIGRQIGKLVGEFRRASNEFKYQIEEELRNVDILEKSSTRPTAATSTLAAPEAASDPVADLPIGQHPNIDTLKTAELNPPPVDLPATGNAGLETTAAEPATALTIAPAEGTESRSTLPHSSFTPLQPALEENTAPLPDAHASDDVHSSNGHPVPAGAEITHG